VVFRNETFQLFCPVAQLLNGDAFVRGEYGKPEGFSFYGLAESQWQYLGICAGLGAVMLVLAVLLYRRRRLEVAGDFIAVKALEPVFLVIYTLGVGAVMYTGADLFANNLEIPFLIVGIAVGFFTGRMLLERRVNVFRWKTFLGFLLLSAALGASVVLTWLDPLGVTRYVPETSQVESLRFYSEDMGYVYGSHRIDSGIVYTEAEDIDSIRGIHRQMVENRDLHGGYVTVTMEYRLKNGLTFTRSYRTSVNGEVGKAARKHLSRWECIFGVTDWDAFVASVWEVSGDPTLDADKIPGLMEAIRADCDAGNMAQDWDFHSMESISYWVLVYSSKYDNESNRSGFVELRIYESCTNTIAYLEKYAELPDWEK